MLRYSTWFSVNLAKWVLPMVQQFRVQEMALVLRMNLRLLS